MKYINRLKLAGWAALSSFVIAGCSSKVYIEREKGTDLSAYNTYQWIQITSAKGDSSNGTENKVTFLSDLANRKLKEAVDARLAEAGFRKDTKNPQILVSYDLLQELGLHQGGANAYNSPFTRWYYNPYYGHGWYQLSYPSRLYGYNTYGEYQDEDKTISLNFIDARTNKTILQAWTTQHTSNPKLTSKEINRAVQDIFRKIEINKKKQSVK